MLSNIYEPPVFVDGTELSAYALNVIDENTARMESLVYGPQPLPLDSWFLSPKAIPLTFNKPYQEIFFGSFLYRKGMTKLTISFYVSFESAYTPKDSRDVEIINFNNSFSSRCGTLAVGILLGSNKSNDSYYTNPADGYRAVAQFNGGYSYLPAGFSISLPNNSYSTAYTHYMATSSQGSVLSGDLFSNLTSDRLKTITIDLTQLALQDSEIVPIKVAIMGSATEPTKTIASNFSKVGSLKYPTMNDLYPGLLLHNRSDPVDTYYIKYNTVDAKILGDLSYSSSWSDTTFPSLGTITATDFNRVANKQRYLVERLRNRPMPLTGSFVFYPIYANSAAILYPQFNNDSLTVLGKELTVASARAFNSEAQLATYAWCPQFSVYDRVGINFKYLTNTNSRAALVLDFPETAISTPASRISIYNNDFLTGYAASGGDKTSKEYPHFVTANRYWQRLSRSLGYSYRSSYGYPFQVRVPSPTTPVYNRATSNYTNSYYLTDGGYFEDTVYIDFQKFYENSYFSAWGLSKGVDGYTAQIGLVAEVPVNLLPQGIAVGNITLQDGYVAVPEYNSLHTGYPLWGARQHWKWVSSNNTALNPRPLVVNFIDYSQKYIESKASYIGFYFQYGVFTINSNTNTYATYTEYSPNYSYTVSGIHKFFKDTDVRLTNLYNNTFKAVNGRAINPHFYEEPIFWGQPQTPLLKFDKDIIDMSSKMFYFTGRRISNFLIVRGRNVTMYYGEFSKVTRDSNPVGSFLPENSVDWSFSESYSVISGDYEGTVVIDLSNVPNLTLGSYYHLKGESIVYAAEFFEEPS